MVHRNPRVYRNAPTIKFIQLNNDSARILKKKLYILQGSKCPVLRKNVKVRDIVLDHRHKLKTQKPGPLGRGLVRGALHFGVNAFEGVILKKYKRYGLTGMIPLPELLRNLADYIEHPTCKQIYIYPSEVIRAPFLKKSEYNKIVKYYKLIFPRRKKIPEYPPSKIKLVGKNKKKKYVARLTKKWIKLLKKVDNYVDKVNDKR